MFDDAASADVDRLVTEYIALWHEPDPGRRRATIVALWPPDGANYTDSITAEGHDAIERRVSAAHETWVAEGGNRFRPVAVDAHHGAVRLRWVMEPVAGGPPAGAGCEILVLDAHGRIRTDHQFPEPLPV